MAIHIPSQMPYSSTATNCCPSLDNCNPCDGCPDHIIRRHDTKPSFRVSMETCSDGAMELEGLVLEVNMWAKGKLKAAIGPADTYIQLAGNIGFNQCIPGDLLVLERTRQPEYAIVTGFDEDNYFIQLQRGFNGTTPGTWKKGTPVKIFRILNAPAVTESRYEDIEQVDGNISRNVLTESYLVYEFQPQDTCVPGCFDLEFKLIKMKAAQFFLPGGKWTGTIHTDANGNYLTGEFQTDSSVPVSVGLGSPDKLISDIVTEIPVFYDDPNFIEPLIPSVDERHYEWWRYIVHMYPSPVDVQLRWAIWDKVIHLDLSDNWYKIPANVHWTGAVHQWTDGNWYTGTSHDDGSVFLDVNGVASQPDATYNETGLVSILCDTCGSSTASVVPSFASISGISNISDISTPSGISIIDRAYGCDLGVGVESVQRFPATGAFRVKISDSPQTEF